MEDVRSYLLSVTGAALLCGVVNRFLGKNGSAVTARALTGLFLILTVLQPLGKVNEGVLDSFTFDFSDTANEAVDRGKAVSQKSMAQIIKQETAAYILEKAKSLQVDIQVTVEVSDDALPTPVRASITGSIAPYAKSQLQDMMEQQLGIPKENQRWT